MNIELVALFCPTCERETLAEAPPCWDGHDDCPDRACVECGTALVLDAAAVSLALPAAARSRRAA